MASKGSKVDASGEVIKSIRLVVDTDADSGLGTALDPVRVDPTGTTVQPVSGTVTVSAITVQPDINLKQVAGAPTDVNSGNASAGTQRVVIASDQATVAVATVAGTKPTYGAFLAAFTPAATPTDVLTISGDGTQIIRLVRLTMMAHATAASAPIPVLIQGTTSLNTGGTVGAGSPRPIDPSDAAIGTIAVVNRYTVNPVSVGGAGGLAFIGSLPVNASGAATQAILDVPFGSLPGAKIPVVRTNVQQISLNFQGVALPAGFGIDYIYVEFTLG